MNDGVYTSIVDAGIAEKLEEEIMYDSQGVITINKNELSANQANTKLTNPNTYYLWMKQFATLT
jgi:hypothetical protein